MEDHPRFHGDARSFSALLGDIFDNLGRMVRGELALAKAELAENLRAAALGIVLVICAMLLLLVALNLLAAALVIAISGPALSPGAAALTVGAGMIVVAALLAGIGASALRAHRLLPKRTMRNIRRDTQSLKEGASHDS